MTVRWRPAYIAIGSNLDSPVDQVRRAMDALDELPDSMLVLRSALYRSGPLGPADQPDFVNAVVAMLTTIGERQLLARLQEIERAFGRKRSAERWGPRVLDLDLLSYSHVVLDEDELVLPHPGIAERNFVLLPWNEIAPQYEVPGLGTVTALLRRVPAKPVIERLDGN